MKRTLRLSESKLIRLVKDIIKEQQVDEVRFTPEQYISILKNVAYQAHLIPEMKRYKGKKIIVTGNLDLSKFGGEKNLVDLGPIKIEGNLDITNTNIKTLDNVEITGTSRHWNTPYQNLLERRARQKKYEEQNERREADEWNLENADDEGLRANAAFQYAVNRGEVETLTDDEKIRIDEITEEIQRLEEEQENLDPNDEDYIEKFDEITEKQLELEDEQDELRGDKVDVYDFYPSKYGHYGMSVFECLTTGFEYSVGTESEADDALYEYYDEQIEHPQHYFSDDFLSRYIDGDAVAETLEDSVRDWVYDEPQSYGVEPQLSRDQEDEIWVLEMEKYILENTGVRHPIQYATKEDGGIFDFEDEEGNRFQYYEEGDNWFLDKNGVRVDPDKIYDDEDTQDHQDDRDSRISDIEYEIQEIKDNPDGDPSDEDIEVAIENYLYDIKEDPAQWLENMGFPIHNFIDKEQLRKDLIQNTEWGEALSHYDSQYDDIDINGNRFIVMRTN